MIKVEKFYKLARPDGYDFYTGATINYREAAEATGKKKIVRPRHPNKKLGLCSSGVIHASRKPNDCFVGADIPCSAYKVTGKPVLDDKDKCGFQELTVLEEISDIDGLLGWNYTEACDPINPLKVEAVLKDEHKDMLEEWASVWSSAYKANENSVGFFVWRAIRDSVTAAVSKFADISFVYYIAESFANPYWFRGSFGSSVRQCIYGYLGSLYPAAKEWPYTDSEPGVYPYRSGSDLWRAGFVASFDDKIWRLHAGEKAEVVYEMEV